MALAGNGFMRGTAELQCGFKDAMSFVRDNSAPPPTRIFDNFYFVGLAGVGAYALKTDDGIILIDALNTLADGEKVIEPGLRQFGLDPAQVKYVIVTHGHGDHYGSARHFAERYGARVLMSAADWDLAINRPFPPGGQPAPGGQPPRFGPPPAKDMVIEDGQQLELGGQRVQLVMTPGHTPGTVSLLIPVTDKGRRHVLAMWGGTGIPRDAAAVRQYIASAAKFEQAARAAGADAELSNHPFVDDSLTRMKWQRENPAKRNPFVIGRAAYLRYSGIISECAKAALAKIEATSAN